MSDDAHRDDDGGFSEEAVTAEPSISSATSGNEFIADDDEPTGDVPAAAGGGAESDMGFTPEVRRLPGDYPENWALLASCTSVFIAALWLPIEGQHLDLTAAHSIAGGFLTVFAGYGMIGAIFNLLHRKMVVFPAILMAFDGLYVSISRLIKLVNGMPQNATSADWMRMAGAGLWIILLCSLWIFLTLFKSASAGRKRDLERKEADRAAKAEARKSSRSM